MRVGRDDYCQTCNSWQRFDRDGKCKKCGRLIKKIVSKVSDRFDSNITNEEEFRLTEDMFGKYSSRVHQNE